MFNHSFRERALIVRNQLPYYLSVWKNYMYVSFNELCQFKWTMSVSGNCILRSMAGWTVSVSVNSACFCEVCLCFGELCVSELRQFKWTVSVSVNCVWENYSCLSELCLFLWTMSVSVKCICLSKLCLILRTGLCLPQWTVSVSVNCLLS